MLRKIIALMLICLAGGAAQGQTPNFKEFFKQKKTQRKYLLKQIALLQLYLGYVKRGYQTVDKGLTLIGAIGEGKFDLDRQYIDDLYLVRGAISGLSKVQAISQAQQQSSGALNDLHIQTGNTPWLTPQEKQHIAEVRTHTLARLDASVTDLEAVTTSAQLAMTDDERLWRINQLYARVIELQTFTRAFRQEVRQLITARALSNSDIDRTTKLFQIQSP